VKPLLALALLLVVAGCAGRPPASAPPPAYPVSFVARPPVDVERPVLDAASADVNGDGRGDVVLLRADGAATWLGNADGTLRAAGVVGLENAARIALADLDADGRPDLVVVRPQAVDVYLGSGGNRALPVPTAESAARGARQDRGEDKLARACTVPLGAGRARRVLVADVSRDGRPDVVILDAAGTSVTTLLGAGGGQLGPPGAALTIPASSDVELADANGDGIPDLWTLREAGASNLVIYFGNGDGQFGMTSELTASPARRMALADLNGDGDVDVVTSAITVLLCNGPLTWGQRWATPVADRDSGMALGDLNGDGLLDLATSDGTTVRILVGNGNGTFQPPTAWRGAAGRLLLLLDVNGDGRLDVITAGEGRSAGVHLHR